MDVYLDGEEGEDEFFFIYIRLCIRLWRDQYY